MLTFKVIEGQIGIFLTVACNCSLSRFDLFSLHVIDSPACLCGHIREDSNHYLLQCPLYFQARNKMLNDIRQLCTFHISGNLLLYGAVELDYATNCKLLMLSMIILMKLVDCDSISPFHITAIDTS